MRKSTWSVGDAVIVRTSRHTFHGIIKRISDVAGNRVPYVVEIREKNGRIRMRNCASNELNHS